jgi:hypothetical protein
MCPVKSCISFGYVSVVSLLGSKFSLQNTCLLQMIRKDLFVMKVDTTSNILNSVWHN